MMQRRQVYLGIAVCLGLIGAIGTLAMGETDRRRNQIIVSPQGPRDGGDFGPHTPGTRTSGLQEALNAAKEQARDVYVAGGSWTAEKTTPVVYNLHETLRIPWMQNFRFDSGHCVLNYVGKTGDAVVFDSQMSCAYRFGLIVSLSDGAVVRMNPTTAGPDRFKVITSTEFVFNALVGGGGAWPGGEAYNSELDTKRRWIGTGLWLDGTVGTIDANKITVLETVGCRYGLLLTGGVSRNTIEETNLHLCQDHLQIGSETDARPCDNRIEAFADSQRITPSSGARLFGARNWLTLSTRPGLSDPDVEFGPTARDNVVHLHSPARWRDRSVSRTNRLYPIAADLKLPNVPVPPSGGAWRNEHPFPIEIRVLDPGRITRWGEKPISGEWLDFARPLMAGERITLAPGESIRLEYTAQPRWDLRGIP